MAQPPPGESPLVLVVDDDDDVRTLISVALRRARLRTIEATNGESALGVVARESIAVVVCDLGMPGLSGLDVVLKLREKLETATLPFILMTGSGDADAMFEAFAAGADDFLAKPIRLDELVARVRAHARTGLAWRDQIANELRQRADAVRAIAQLHVSDVPEIAAETIVADLVHRTLARYVGILQLSGHGRLRPLAAFSESVGLVRGGPLLDLARTRDLVARARAGPWIVGIEDPDPGESRTQFWDAGLDLAAGAPIHAGEALVGILTIGLAGLPAGTTEANRRGQLLARTIDYAAMLSASFGPALAGRRELDAERSRLRRVLRNRAFRPVYQPIVALVDRRIVGFEALTRFHDEVPPDARFAEAGAVGLGLDFELAAVEAALTGIGNDPDGAFVSVNIGPEVVMASGPRLAELVKRVARPLVIEVTEHAAISDYETFRSRIDELGGVQLAIDDAGAGYASLRHILELGPAYVKLDFSLVHGIDADPLRQALAAGIVYFGLRAGFGLIAEGVETNLEAATLLEIGVELGQGYLFGRPQSAAT